MRGGEDNQIRYRPASHSLYCGNKMKKTSHLKWSLVVALFVFLFAIGEPDWWRYVTFVCYMYFFGFIRNLFHRLYESENAVTRFLFGTPEVPLFVAVLLIVLSVIIRKVHPEAIVNGLYLCAIVGGAATLIAIVKARRLDRRDTK